MDERVRDAFRQFSRNARWGTCAACPRDTRYDHAYPEFCPYTDRYDHHLTLDALTKQHEAHGEQPAPKGAAVGSVRRREAWSLGDRIALAKALLDLHPGDMSGAAYWQGECDRMLAFFFGEQPGATPVSPQDAPAGGGQSAFLSRLDSDPRARAANRAGAARPVTKPEAGGERWGEAERHDLICALTYAREANMNFRRDAYVALLARLEAAPAGEEKP